MDVNTIGGIESVEKRETDFLITYLTGEQTKINILNRHVIRYFMSPSGEFPDYPEPNNPDDKAKITSKKISDYDKTAFQESELKEHNHEFIINTHKIHIILDKITGALSVYDKRSEKHALKEIEPLSYVRGSKSTQILRQHSDEYFFGGGMQNGRFSHKGEIIRIKNTNDWDDGGVTSPCPFYWSSYGYGILRNTWKEGIYDFGTLSHTVATAHNAEDFDVFIFINPVPKHILQDYFELTGRPIFMPEYAHYEAHLNTFNRDYWVEVEKGEWRAILFEDGKYYKKYQPNQMNDKTGVLESLNGEKNNYQFSARAMIDRYKKHDMPLGWFVPNDGYGSGYGQTDSLDGDIENLREFSKYSRSNGVELALWTESQLEPKDPENPKKGERDLRKEVSVAGVVALKCDVAWIGSGYSFGLNAVENAANIFVSKSKARPMIIMVDGWAGTQRYSGIWSGDQRGGQWEYIRFHIPTYVGSGLSGLPIIGSDMDGIYAGGNREVNIRDFQWKTFTPLQLNMDGWGNIPKTPFSFDDEAKAINRAYLKLKSSLMPYNYTISFESTCGLPMIRAMFLEFPKEIPAYTKDSQYQFMWGPYFLIAPIFSPNGDMKSSIRNGIYLPDTNQIWIDFLTGNKYQGGKIYNNIVVPLWKMPIFVKEGSIVPMTYPNNNPNEIKRDVRILNIYPCGKTEFEIYEDDGKSSDYLENRYVNCKIKVHGPHSNEQGDLYITIGKAKGDYTNMVKERTTIIRINASKAVHHVKAAINDNNISVHKVKTQKEFDRHENVFYYKEDFLVDPYLEQVGDETLKQKFLLVKIRRVDISRHEIHIKVKGYENKSKIFGANNNVTESLLAPADLFAHTERAMSITLIWQPVDEARYYEVERNGIIFTNIFNTSCAFETYDKGAEYTFKVRSTNELGVSKWSDPITVIDNEIEDCKVGTDRWRCHRDTI